MTVFYTVLWARSKVSRIQQRTGASRVSHQLHLEDISGVTLKLGYVFVEFARGTND